jgi:hypothetical protein
MLSMPRIVRPDPHALQAVRNLVLPLHRLLAGPLSETKNCQKHLIGSVDSQPCHSRTKIRQKPCLIQTQPGIGYRFTG